MNLPSRIQSIKQPNWIDTLHWIFSDGMAMADVDHDWRLWVKANGEAVVKHKGHPRTHYFDNLTNALEFLDYRPKED